MYVYMQVLLFSKLYINYHQRIYCSYTLLNVLCYLVLSAFQVTTYLFQMDIM